MNPIAGVDLKKVTETADKALIKIAENRLTDYLRGLKVQAHNQRMKVQRLRNEADQGEATAKKIVFNANVVSNAAFVRSVHECVWQTRRCARGALTA